MKSKDKMAKTMGEYKRGTLHSGSKKGPKVTSRKQAIAIGMNQARKAGEKTKRQRTAPKEPSDKGSSSHTPRARKMREKRLMGRTL